MAVRDILGSEMKGMTPRETPGKTSTPSPKDRYASALGDAIELKGFRDGLGIREDNGNNNTGITTADMIKAQTDLLTTFINNFTKMSTGNAGYDPSSFLIKEVITPLRQEVQELKRSTQEGEGGGGDPLEVLNHALELQENIIEKYKKRLGLPEVMGPNGTIMGNITAMTEIERMRNEEAERERRWKQDREDRKAELEEEREERRRRYLIEDRQWEALRQMELMRFRRDSQERERKSGIFNELASSILTGIQPGDRSGGHQEISSEYQPATDNHEQDVVNEVQEFIFTCQEPECGSEIKVRSDMDEVTCPGCGTTYKAKED